MNYEKLWRELKHEITSLVNASIESKAYLVTPFYQSILDSMHDKEHQQMVREIEDVMETDAQRETSRNAEG